MKNNLFIIHGYNGDTTETFGPYLEKEAQKINVDTYFPSFPIRQEATFENWSEVMDTYLEKGLINEKSIIVAHSLGTLFIPRYLATKNIHIHLYISLAGFLNDHSGREDLKIVVEKFKSNEDQIDKAIKLIDNRYSIYSDNDHLNPKEELESYAERFDSKKVFISGIGHMGRKSGVTEIPQVIDIIKSFI